MKGGTSVNAVVLRFAMLLPAVIALATCVHADAPTVVVPQAPLTSEKLGAYIDELIDSLAARDEFSDIQIGRAHV